VSAIVADTSALVAVVLAEPEAELLGAALQRHEVVVSAVSLIEASIVLGARQGADGTRELDALVDHAVEEVVACDHDHARAAVAAWRRFGRGRHPARLNFGDCVSYATAVITDAPLLFKGDDFAQTDIRSALG